MTKEVELTIKGFQKYADHKDNDLETRTLGEYYFRNNCHYILYEEMAEGFSQSTKNMLKIRDGYLEMSRKGLINTNMVFEKGKETVSNYKTPFGEFLFGIHTKSLTIRTAENLIDAEVKYALKADDRQMAECSIQIQICSK